jgi:hypothetical protein
MKRGKYLWCNLGSTSRSIGSNAKSDAWWIADVLRYWISLSQ